MSLPPMDAGARNGRVRVRALPGGVRPCGSAGARGRARPAGWKCVLAACGFLLPAGCGDTTGIGGEPVVFSAVSAGGDHGCGRTKDGAVYCWGRGENGELGDGQVRNSAMPVRVATDLRFLAVSAGGHHTCALAEDGAAYCWGWNVAGQLGTANTVGYGAPAAVAGGLHFAAISSGAHHTCGITTDGAAYCWGDNGNGQLGNGSATPAAQPAPVAGGLRFAAIGAGAGHSCAVTPEGEAYCWGLNHLGQLGTGGFDNAWEPVAVAGGVQFTAISAGFAHSCALTPGADAYCWGSNSAGELGNTFVERPRTSGAAVPGKVHGGTAFLSIEAGAHYTCGVAEDARALCWGLGLYGQLGTARTLNYATPQSVMDTPASIAPRRMRVTAVSTGGAHTCARATIGDIFCWGTGELGQLGNPSYTYTTIPVRVTVW